MSNLKSKAVNGVIWTTINTIASTIIAPLLLVLKARYLIPTEFGVLAIISVQQTIINVLDNFGISTAIIQRDIISKNERSSIFVLELGMSTFFALVMTLLAPVIANIFDMEPLITLIPLLSVSLIFSGSDNIFQSFLEKEFFFKELSIIKIIREVLLVFFTFVFLYLNMGLFGVVLAQVLSSILNTVAVLIVSFQKDLLHLRIHFKFREVIPFLKFGSYVVGKQIMTQLTHSIDELIIGYFLSAEVLGLYYFAKNLLNRIRILLTTSFSKVLFPLLSAVKNDKKLLLNTYHRVSKYVGIFAFPFFIGLAITADMFIPIFFGEQWIDSVGFFVILSLAYIPYILTANLATSLLYSLNYPDIVMNTDIVVNIIYIVLLLIFSILKMDIYPTVILYAAYLVFKTGTLQYFANKVLHTHLFEYFTLFKYSIIASITMVVLVVLTRTVIPSSMISMLKLTLSVIVGVITYGSVMFNIDKKSINEIFSLIKNRGV